MYCPKCHATVPNDANFCHKCGLDLNVPYVEEVGPEPELAAPMTEMLAEEPKPRHTVATLWERLGIRAMAEQTIAEFQLEGTAAELVAAMPLQAYAHGVGTYLMVSGIYRYYASGTGSTIVFRILLAEDALGDPAAL